MSGVKVDGAWKTPGTVYTKVDGVWKVVSSAYTKVDGVWKMTTFGGPPPQPTFSWYSTGVFSINNYSSLQTYTATLVSGSGTASLNTTTGRYTLSDANARFSVTASWAAGTPASIAGYIERKAYTYDCRSVCGTCCDTCCISYCTCGCSAPIPGNGCPSGTSPNGQCGCGGGTPCMFGCIGCAQYGSCNCHTCCSCVWDIFHDYSGEGYINSGTEWYKVA